MMSRKFVALCACTFFIPASFAQKKEKLNLSLDGIWSGFFDEKKKQVHMMHTANRFAFIEARRDENIEMIFSLDFETGKMIDTVFSNQEKQSNNNTAFPFTFFEDFEFSPDDAKLLIKTQTEPLYNNSSKAVNFVWDREKKTLLPVSTSNKQWYCSFSPDSKKLAYVTEGNLYIKNLVTNSITPVTLDGSMDNDLYGMADALYENNFGMLQAYQWSPDGQYLALLRFNERAVQ